MRRFFFGLMVGAVLLPSSLVAATPAGSTPAVRHGDDEAGRSIYNVMATVPVADRKVLFRGLSASMKASVWRAHLDNFSSAHAVSPAQAAVINEAKSLLSDELFAVHPTDADWESQVHAPLQRLEESAKNLFPQDLVVEAFGQVGPGDTGEALIETVSRQRISASGLRNSLVPLPEMVSECTCSDVSDMCWFGSSCSGSICYRSDSDGGCGFMWAYQCDSKCSKNT
jgi:hypothetical protein